MDKVESVVFMTDDGESVEFFVLEQTMINGTNYILVTDDVEDEEAFVYIMRENAEDVKDDLHAYEMVEDENELLSVSKLFEQLLDDIDIEVE